MVGQARLSKRQTRILEVIRDYTEEYGYPPTIREIGDLAGVSSTSVVSYNLKVLQAQGLLVRDRDVSRGLRLIEDTLEAIGGATEAPSDFISIPILGAIAAGLPLPLPDSDASLADADSIRVA